MFNGEKAVRIRAALPREELEDIVADVFDRVGEVRFFGRSRFRVRADGYNTAFAAVSIEGELIERRAPGEWTLALTFEVKPTALCWVIAVVGWLLFVFGPLIFLAPIGTKNEVERRVKWAARDAADEAEEEADRRAARPGPNP